MELALRKGQRERDSSKTARRVAWAGRSRRRRSMQIYSIGGVVRRDVASIYRAWRSSSPLRRVTYNAPSRSAVHQPQPGPPSLPAPFPGHFRFWRAHRLRSRRIISISHRPVGIITPLRKGALPPLLSPLRSLISSFCIIVFQRVCCSNALMVSYGGPIRSGGSRSGGVAIRGHGSRERGV